MKYTKFKFIGILAICILAIFSCSKESELISDGIASEDSSVELRSERSFDLPTANGDHYSFRDFDHLTNYYQSLDAMYSKDDQEFNSVVSSNRRGVNTVHDKLINDEFENPKDRYQPFLTDPIMMAIVNEHFEFEVENVLITYMNNSDLLISDPNDSATKNSIRNLTKGGELDFNSIPNGAYWGEDTNVASLKPWCGCEIKIEQISCNEVRVFGTCKNFVWGSGEGLVQIFISNSQSFPGPDPFGNPPTPNQSHNIDGGFSFTVTLNPTQPIFVHASANPDCFVGGIKTSTLEFDPDADACDFNERNTGWLWAQDNGVQGFSHRTAYYKNFWSSYEEAKMFSKYWTGSEWKKNDQDLRVEIDAIRKNSECQQFEHENEVKTCHCDNKRARVNSGISGEKNFVHHCDGDVTGIYKKTLNWQGITWSIDAVGEVDFECCE